MISPTDTYLTTRQAFGPSSGVSWAAIFAGAAAAAVISTLLVLLGLGLGFSTYSPWLGQGSGEESLGVAGTVWLIVTQILASALGGYLAARLRSRRTPLHDDEVRFRDMAHGFLAWTLATLLTLTLIVGTAASLIGGGLRLGSSMASGALGSAGSMVSALSGQEADYFVDSLLRSDRTILLNDEPPHAVVLRIFNRALASEGTLSAADRSYLTQLVSQRNALSQVDAEQRVERIHAQALKSMDDARTAALKAADSAASVAARGALWSFITLLCGAIFASLAAVYGGRRRDALPVPDSPAHVFDDR